MSLPSVHIERCASHVRCFCCRCHFITTSRLMLCDRTTTAYLALMIHVSYIILELYQELKPNVEACTVIYQIINSIPPRPFAFEWRLIMMYSPPLFYLIQHTPLVLRHNVNSSSVSPTSRLSPLPSSPLLLALKIHRTWSVGNFSVRL